MLAEMIMAAAVAHVPAPGLACPNGHKIDWARIPSSDDYAEYYPRRLPAAEGRVTLACVVDEAGMLQACKAVGEIPASSGVADAALRMARLFRVARPGCPVPGHHVRVPIRFVNAPEPPGPSVPPSPADPCTMERAYQRSAELLAEAGTAANEKQYQMANDLLKRATAELGDYYLQLPTPPTLDDSGMHLVLADDAERRGDLSMSISIRQRMLEGRLATFRRFHPKAC